MCVKRIVVETRWEEGEARTNLVNVFHEGGRVPARVTDCLDGVVFFIGGASEGHEVELW